MCEQTEINYLDGEVVWVKLGSCWWPGEVIALEKLPPDVLRSFRKPPIAVVKFFQEDKYEYVKNINSIYKYNCRRKHEFISKGLYMFRTKHGHMEKFPEDIIRAETAVGGDVDILSRDEFQETKKQSYAGIFGDTPKKTPSSGKSGRGRAVESPSFTPTRKMKEKSDYKVHILLQGSKSAGTSENNPIEAPTTPSTSCTETELQNVEEKPPSNEDQPEVVEKPVSTFTTPVASSSGIYSCHACPFTTSRLNVLILHNKSHSISFTPYTPSPIVKKSASKPASRVVPKVRRIRTEKKEKLPKVKTQGKKRVAEEQADNEVKKPKTDEEIKSSLLADWDDVDDESNDESSMIMTGSPEMAVAAESPAVPTPAELPSAQVPAEISSPIEKKPDSSPSSDKPESSSDSKYEFCEDEDWPLEADAGRKIPRVKNPKRKEDSKSLSLDEDDMAREVAELLNKTGVPELPAVPDSLKVEENFPEPSIVKSPDKNSEKSPDKLLDTSVVDAPPSKAIFKTKTFFRSRHSRSQDAIGKYVAEQLNAVERMDISESELNGSEAVSSPEARESPPIEHIKVAKLAPKIQLKKMKAEAAQLREKEKYNQELISDLQDSYLSGDNMPNSGGNSLLKMEETTIEKPLMPSLSQDVIYPTQEIKPVVSDSPEPIISYVVESIESTEPVVSESPEPMKSVESESQDSIKSDVPDSPDSMNPDVSESLNPIKPDVSDSSDSIKPDFSEPSDSTQPNVLESPEPTEPVVSESPQPLKPVLSSEPITPLEIEYANDKIEGEIEVKPKQTIDSMDDVKVEAYVESEKQSNEETDSQISELKIPETTPQKTFEPPVERYMNESTASAVDALLSVSRDTDRVARIISNDPPDELFEDDNKDTTISNNVNGNSNENLQLQNDFIEDKDASEYNNIAENHTNEQNHTNNQEIADIVVPKEQNVNDSQNMQIDDNGMITFIAEISNEKKEIGCESNESEKLVENLPSESDLQIAETLINLPSSAIQSKTSNEHLETIPLSISSQIPPKQEDTFSNNDDAALDQLSSNNVENSLEKANISAENLLIGSNENMKFRYETEQEKSENLNAAQSLVQMSESVDHKINILEPSVLKNTKKSDNSVFALKQNNGIDRTVEQKVALLSNENKSETSKGLKFETSSSKLLKILEEPMLPKPSPNSSASPVLASRKEKILNFDVAKSSLKGKSPSPKQKIIIRRTASNKTTINNISDVVTTPEKIILSRSNNPTQDGSAVQTYTIQTSPDTPSDTNTIIIQQKIRKIAKPPTKLQKIKPHNSLVAPLNEPKTTKATTSTDDAIFDINSMPIVLSEDLLTPENIEKMPVVMSDGNIISHASINPPKLVKTKQPMPVECEKIAISSNPNKSEIKTLLMNPVSEVSNVTTPNILSKSSKLRGAKTMLLIDKTTGKQKIIMTKAEPSVKELKQTTTVMQSVSPTGKPEKFIILPTPSSPRPGRAQKIVIDPQTGKAHVLVTKGSEAQCNPSDNKPVSAKLIAPPSDATTPGNTVMIITNAQGAQSRILLTPEHEKFLFPNKQQANISQLKTIAQRINTNTQKNIGSVGGAIKSQTVTSAKNQTRLVPKQKNAIITSKGQLIVGGRVATTVQNIAPMPETRPLTKRIVGGEAKKIVQTLPKTSEPLIFLQQKSGAMMQLTAAQFEHLQKTGQIIQKTVPVTDNKIILQKSISITPNEPMITTVPKSRVRKAAADSPTSAKKIKQEITIAPAPIRSPGVPVPALTPISNTTATSIVPPVSNTVSVSTSGHYSEYDNFEELLPSSSISRQPESVAPQADLTPAQPQTNLSDGQLLAVPGEPFGGPTGSFYLCVEENGTLTPIDNRPLILENNQLVPMPVEPLQVLAQQPERRDILEAALANSDVFHADTSQNETREFRDLNANLSVHSRVSETSTINQPIMTPVEVPTKADTEVTTIPSNLEDGLAVIGVTPHTVPTSLELPITVTDPRIAPKTTDPLSGPAYGASLLPSPSAEMSFVTTEEAESSLVGPISMPLLTEEESVGKSMPILTDDVQDRTVSSIDSTVESPSSMDVRESESEETGNWSRRLLTPGSDISEASAEIPLQPAIQLSVNDMSRHS